MTNQPDGLAVPLDPAPIATGLLAEAGIPNPGQVLGGLVRSAVENALGSAGPGTIDLSSIRGTIPLEDD